MAASSNAGCFIYIANQSLSVATFLNHLSWIWVTCCSFYISSGHGAWHFEVMEVAPS